MSFLNLMSSANPLGLCRCTFLSILSERVLAAEKLPDRIRGEIKEDRSRQMIELAENMKEKFYRKYEGKIVSILAEQEKEAGTVSWNYPESHGRVI